jgi:hypothetical protein
MKVTLSKRRVLANAISRLERLCENCEDMPRSCDTSVRLLSYPYIQAGFKDEQDVLLLKQWDSPWLKSIAS